LKNDKEKKHFPAVAGKWNQQSQIKEQMRKPLQILFNKKR
jgi:hypothetical protein